MTMNNTHQLPSDDEMIINWYSQIEDAGPAQPLARLDALIEAAPESVMQTDYYHYLRGLADGRRLHEHWGGVGGVDIFKDLEPVVLKG